ncbi:delta-sarcoglycan-like [Maniola jurtina]|uniref:delta-sarcoglycan-like n=1 Tax=Maniola jurtina TaxID=191418 RepID=UPI001E68AAD3|nr:delta-sarcoglycan-like [Maniola jurtina]XP_045763733.1 delta-sarcoglycan-like [Maniola jurtina]XP_045763734.1 delta-sarcoglycan-like [Maniola jurtina]XP_045763735.1 delta-sarcoglycan-like [Maniola jurtina]XP_045763736.1 delta-sarcoglycan-like [Maniola jurtina]XP_045763737.1 delta-sarcoglycan-like [Maniola jurtina]XP_045763738.1 delta-sarcoglycan-like [Maniola jurtina]XP_045763739.1 delta-sarcoglycan-like [Maniola jurtina]
MKVEDTTAEGIRGWGCTPTGDPPPAAVNTSNATKSSCLPEWVSRGWKRNLLYGIIVFLMVLVFLNIALTLWIISTLRLTARGIGPITIIKDGVHLDGQVWVVDKLVASTISSQAAQPITLYSHRNFSVLVSEPGHVNLAKLVIKRDIIECSGQVFEVRDAKGGEVFYASREEVRVSAEALTLDGAGGLTVKSALQTPVVRAPPGSDLQLESLTRRLDVRAPQSIFLESRAGGIDITSHSNITLKSDVGAIKLHASNIIIHNLKEASVTEVPQKKTWGRKVYQLCACASGKLFLAAPESICAMHDHDIELCR